MADKKVERNVRSSDEERPTTPTEKLQSSISKAGTLSMAHLAADKAKSTLLDKFREREERYRREQSAAAQAEGSALPLEPAAGEPPKSE